MHVIKVPNKQLLLQSFQSAGYSPMAAQNLKIEIQIQQKVCRSAISI